MKDLRVVLRLLTIASFSLPFTFFMVTCDGTDIKFSFNAKEAEKNIKLQERHRDKLQVEQLTPDSTKRHEIELKQDTIDKSTPLQNQTTKKVLDQILIKAIMPTNESVSAIGATFYFKNDFGKGCVATGITTFLLSLIPFKFWIAGRKRLYALLVSAICFLVLILDCLLSEVDMLWGLWIVIGLIVVQLVMELRKVRSHT